MHPSIHKLAALCLAATLAACANTDCNAPQQPFAVFDNVPVYDKAPVITVDYGGQPLHLQLDTGSGGTLIKPEAAARVGIPVLGAATMTVHGIGGDSVATFADARMLTIGGRHSEIGLALVVPVRMLPKGIDGLLGVSTVREYAFDIDLPHRRVAIYEGNRCKFLPPDFPAAGQSTDLSADAGYTTGNGFQVPVGINGHDGWAMLDTGAQMTLLGTASASAPVVTDPDKSAVQSFGLSGTPSTAHVVKLAAFKAGGQTFHDVPVVLTALPISQDMLLGADQLSQQRIWLDFYERRVIFGPRMPADKTPAAAAPVTPAPSAPSPHPS